MYKIILALLLGAMLSAEMINGVSVVVKGEAITIRDVKDEMHLSKVNATMATDILIRKKLEAAEIQERKITVTSSEIYDDIKKVAAANNLSIDAFYDAVRESNGLTSEEFKEKTREKLLSQKLYSAIAYSSMSMPDEEEMKEYYELHKDEFSRPKSFKVIIYSSPNEEALRKKITTPMFISDEVKVEERELPYDKISPELAKLLEKTEDKNFTPVVMDQQGGHVSFYLQEAKKSHIGSYEDVKNQLSNTLMGQKREQVLSDYFARLRGNADIQIVREVK
ncbi:MAG: peptidylprolyl isomerase [Sulfurimonas sp.]|jgi:parvulin-like peptidyl-prolyl isomerase|uniref:peptidylprolyl isomerase n=1 Tax=Sulfurimonas sp. TaxID=2022749 RepID=UPI002615E6F7|nr:peptidylprolyl isomerase [Sulfurimonas sp.]MDD3475280.1 peptidylprolyl isomerase [Sulfurimonas sp.]